MMCVVDHETGTLIISFREALYPQDTVLQQNIMSDHEQKSETASRPTDAADVSDDSGSITPEKVAEKPAPTPEVHEGVDAWLRVLGAFLLFVLSWYEYYLKAAPYLQNTHKCLQGTSYSIRRISVILPKRATCIVLILEHFLDWIDPNFSAHHAWRLCRPVIRQGLRALADDTGMHPYCSQLHVFKLEHRVLPNPAHTRYHVRAG